MYARRDSSPPEQNNYRRDSENYGRRDSTEKYGRQDSTEERYAEERYSYRRDSDYAGNRRDSDYRREQEDKYNSYQDPLDGLDLDEGTQVAERARERERAIYTIYNI